MRAWWVHLLGGVTDEEHAAKLEDVGRELATLGQADLARAEADLARQYDDVIADLRLAADQRARQAVAGELERLQVLADDSLEVMECLYSTFRIHLGRGGTGHFRLFTTGIGCVGAGFTRPLDLSETNLSAPYPLGDFLTRAISAELYEVVDERPGRERPRMGGHERAAIERAFALRFEVGVLCVEAGPLTWVLDGTGLPAPFRLPQGVEDTITTHTSQSVVLAMSGRASVPERTVDIRVNLWGHRRAPAPPASMLWPMTKEDYGVVVALAVAFGSTPEEIARRIFAGGVRTLNG